MIKRIFDITFSLIALLFFGPILIVAMISIWMQDFKNPIYVSNRVGKSYKEFRFLKLRSMIVNADKSGVDSTSNNDIRITFIGRFIRKFKLDELPQFVNVLNNSMSVVGPRPNVPREVVTYTEAEKKLLEVKPGITDIASIVFSDEGDILSGSTDPDLDYQRLIRPGKAALGIFYVENNNLILDISLIFLTIVSIFSKRKSRAWLAALLSTLGANNELVELSKREKPLVPMPILGTDKVVTARKT